MLDDRNISAILFRNERALIVTDELTPQGNVLRIFELLPHVSLLRTGA